MFKEMDLAFIPAAASGLTPLKADPKIVGRREALSIRQRNVPLYERIHEMLWAKLVDGEIRAHDRLRDGEWAKRLGVSRTPVREALRKMEQDGILSLLPYGGYEVRPLSAEDTGGLVACCAVLEGLAAREIARHRTADDLGMLRSLVGATRLAIGQARYEEALNHGRAFRDAVVLRSNIPYLMGLHAPVRRLLLICESNAARALPSQDRGARLKRRCQRMRVMHRGLLHSIETGEARAAARHLEAHVRADASLW